MSQKYKEVGGGPTTGLANDFVNFLSQGLNTGSFGAGNPAGSDAVNSTTGIAGVLNDILSGGAGNAGGALASLIRTDTNDQVNTLRARYGAGGGTAYGTGAQYAEGVLRSRQAPQLTNAIGGLQLGLVQNLLGIIGGTASKGITQRQGTLEESPWMTGLKIALPIAGSVLGSMGADRGVPSGTRSPTDMTGLPGMSGPLPGMSLTPGGGMPSAMAPITSMPIPWTPSLFDYGLR